MTGWRTASRVARRSVRRNLGRSLLIIALVALPVMAATVADGIVRTLTDRENDLDQWMGTADAKINFYAEKPFDVEPLLPSGSRVVPLLSPYPPGGLRLSAGDRIVRTRLRPITALGDPLTAHLARLTDGRLPRDRGEALVTTPLAETLGLLDADGHLRPRSTVGAVDGPRVTVTGLVVEPYCLTCMDVVAAPDSLLAPVAQAERPTPMAFLVDLPPGADAAAVARAWPVNRSTITTRESFSDAVPFGNYLEDVVTQPVLLFAGLALLGIVITAGAAFAVGARGQMRDLGLVAVNGGAARHVRRIVLAQGVVLGVLGAATGLVAGAVVMVLGVPLWQRITGQLMENPRFGWGELTAAAAVGIIAGVAASAVPAFAVARLQPADALAGRFRVAGPTARTRFLGLVMVVAGLAAVVVSGAVSRDRIAAYEALRQRNLAASWPDRTLPAIGTAAGVAITMAGLLLVMPAVLAAVGRLGSRLPLSGRLAVRDAVRHRHRTVAAGAAIMVTVAASVVTAFVFTARAESEPKTMPPNTVLAEVDSVATAHASPADRRGQVERAGANATRAVPGATAVAVTTVSSLLDREQWNGMYAAASSSTPDCRFSAGTVAVASPQLIELATGRAPEAAVLTALAGGKAVSYDPCLVTPDGTVELDGLLPAQAILPAHVAAPAAGTHDWILPKLFVSAETAKAHGWIQQTDRVAITYPAPSDLDAVRAAVEDAGVDLSVAETVGGYVTGLYYLLAGLAALVAFLGAGVTVALSATDGRADLATLAALGAPGRRRRVLAGANALVVTMLGTVLGLAVGVCAAFAAVPIMGMSTLPVPWRHLLLTTLAVPALASVVAAVATPSRLPMVARS